MGGLELHHGPHGPEVVVGEDDHRPPAVLHALEDLVGDGAAWGPVPAVDQTFVLRDLRLLWSLQSTEQDVFNVLGVLVGVGEEHVVVLPVVQDVLREEVATPGLREDEDDDDVTVDIAEYHHHGGHYQQTEADDDELHLKRLADFLPPEFDDLLAVGVLAVQSNVLVVRDPVTELLDKL